jgi:tetratricopeptide (TPR) repeat protein
VIRISLLALVGLAFLASCAPGPVESVPASPEARPLGEPDRSVKPESKEKAALLAAEGTKVMTDGKLTPMEKYPKALDLYRQALELDPANKEAKENKDLIESIYKSMGKAIPGAK